MMRSLKGLSEQEKKADLADFVEVNVAEVMVPVLFERDHELEAASYQMECQFHAPLLAAFILNEIGFLYMRANKKLAQYHLGRAVYHLYAGWHAGADCYSATACRFARSSDNDLLKLFLSHCDAYEKTVGRKKILSRYDGSLFSDNAEYCETWNVLVEAAVYQSNPAMLSQIAIQYPAAVGPALAALTATDELLKKFPQTMHIVTEDEVRNARYKILLILQSPLHDHYKVSYEDKRFVEYNLLLQIENLATTRAILDFYRQYYEAFVVMQHRYYCLAYITQRLFQRSEIAYPSIRVRIVEALQKKFYEKISTVMDSSILEEGLNGLFKESHSIAGVSVKWRKNVVALMKLLSPNQIEMKNMHPVESPKAVR